MAQEERGESLHPYRGTGHWALLNYEWESIKLHVLAQTEHLKTLIFQPVNH